MISRINFHFYKSKVISNWEREKTFSRARNELGSRHEKKSRVKGAVKWPRHTRVVLMAAAQLTLASLANAAAQSSAAVDNSTNLYLDVLFQLKVKSNASS